MCDESDRKAAESESFFCCLKELPISQVPILGLSSLWFLKLDQSFHAGGKLLLQVFCF